MNLMRQRDDLKAAAATCIWRPGMLESALSSPVFQWWHGEGSKVEDKEIEFIFSNLLEEVEVISPATNRVGSVLWPRFTPYECFRISLMDTADYYQFWFTNDEITCFHCDDHASHKDVLCWTMHHKRKVSIGQWNFGMWVNGKRMELPDFRSGDGDDEETLDFKAGKVHVKVSTAEMRRYASHVIRILGVFMFDIYGAGSSVIKVSPKPDATKSVQWRQAREHYLVLRRNQVEKLIESKGSVSDEDIIRAAHWRRAHLRRLSSGKFVNKRGLLVPVKKAWVGPEEWEGKDGKVYTVVGMEPPSLTGVS